MAISLDFHVFARTLLRLQDDDIDPVLRMESDTLIPVSDLNQVQFRLGQELGRREIAANLLGMGLPVDTIAKASGLSEREVLALRDGSPGKDAV